MITDLNGNVFLFADEQLGTKQVTPASYSCYYGVAVPHNKQVEKGSPEWRILNGECDYHGYMEVAA